MLISKKISFNPIILKINHNYPFNKLTQNTFIMYDRRSYYIKQGNTTRVYHYVKKMIRTRKGLQYEEI